MIFDINVLTPGDAVKLIVPPRDFNEEKKFNAMIKHVSPFSITLIVGYFDVEEKEYPIEMFEGSSPLQLVPMYTEDEWKEAIHLI